MNKYNSCWQHLKRAKRIQNKWIMDNPVLQDNPLPATMDILAFIGANPNTTLTAITKEPYFSNLSLSTLKRCVLELLECKAIRSTQATDDKRARHLEVIQWEK